MSVRCVYLCGSHCLPAASLHAAPCCFGPGPSFSFGCQWHCRWALQFSCTELVGLQTARTQAALCVNIENIYYFRLTLVPSYQTLASLIVILNQNPKALPSTMLSNMMLSRFSSVKSVHRMDSVAPFFSLSMAMIDQVDHMPHCQGMVGNLQVQSLWHLGAPHVACTACHFSFHLLGCCLYNKANN